MVNCGDLFYWATADAEDITPETVEEFAKAKEDGGSIYGESLYACRVRKMRPQGAAYPEDTKLWPLFDACGPPRDTDKGAFGNPKPHPGEAEQC